MTALFEDNFEIYGSDALKMLDGVWASLDTGPTGDVSLTVPAWEEEGRYWLEVTGRGDAARAVFPTGGVTGVGVWTEMYLPSLPTTADRGYPIQLRNAADDALIALVINTDGTISAFGNPAGFNVDGTAGATLIATTSIPVLQAATTHKIQMECDLSAGDIEVRVDGATVINVSTNANVGGTCVGIAHQQNDSAGGTYAPMYFKATAAYSLAGTYNSSWPNISGIKTVLINEDTATDNLTPRPRDHFDAPVLYVQRDVNARSGLSLSAADTAFDFGTADYTIEGWFRFERQPESGETFMLAGVWDEDQNQRSYVLSFKASDVDGGGLQYQYSTDGASGTVATLHDINFEPQLGLWYHIAVCRDSSSTESLLFIDGVQQGSPQADATSFFTGAVPFTIGNGYDNNVADVNAFQGHIQDVRVTKGVARYTSNFSPPTTFLPTDVGSDPNFTSVSLLTQLNDVTEVPPVDESDNAFTIVVQQSAVVVDYADSPASYLVAGVLTPLDDRYLESALVKASGVLTLDTNPSDGDTVTLGASTYTFKTTLTPTAGEVLIGADIDESLSNLTAAINGGDGSGTAYASGTATNTSATAQNATPTTNQMTATAILGGTAGNSIASTETFTAVNNVWAAATLANGANLPGASEFGVQSLPPDATGVRWLSIKHRTFALGGSATMRTNLDVNGSESANADEGLTPDPQYYTSRIEEDPDTAAALTVSSVENAKIKIERTA